MNKILNHKGFTLTEILKALGASSIVLYAIMLAGQITTRTEKSVNEKTIPMIIDVQLPLNQLRHEMANDVTIIAPATNIIRSITPGPIINPLTTISFSAPFNDNGTVVIYQFDYSNNGCTNNSCIRKTITNISTNPATVIVTMDLPLWKELHFCHSTEGTSCDFNPAARDITSHVRDATDTTLDVPSTKLNRAYIVFQANPGVANSPAPPFTRLEFWVNRLNIDRESGNPSDGGIAIQ